MSEKLIIRQLGLQPYERVLVAMRSFTNERTASSNDEIWLVQHPPVFTQGQTGKAEHILRPTAIPIVQSDRGGQVTFHGPGQQVMYVLLDLRRRMLGVRALITLLEQVVLATLARFSIVANTRSDAPGVYIGIDKICSLGLRICKGCTLHGLALNIAMDLSPFSYINPCGYTGLHMTQMSDLLFGIAINDVTPVLITEFLRLLDITSSDIHGWDYSYYL